MVSVHRAGFATALGLASLLLVSAASGQPITASRLVDELCPEARSAIASAGRWAVVTSALEKLEGCQIPRQLLFNLLRSPRTAPYLAASLPQLADLADRSGVLDLVRRFAGNGQGVAYELTVAHAFRDQLVSLSSFSAGNEVDGLLRSGLVIESKSAPPRRPEHLLEQLRRRAGVNNSVLLALAYMPGLDEVARLRTLGAALGGRLTVQHIRADGSGYQPLVIGHDAAAPRLPLLPPALGAAKPTLLMTPPPPGVMSSSPFAPAPSLGQPSRSSLAAAIAPCSGDQRFVAPSRVASRGAGAWLFRRRTGPR